MMKKWMEKLSNSIIAQVTFFLMVMTFLFSVFFIWVDRIHFNKATEGEIVIDMEVTNNINALSVTGEHFLLSGWVFRQNSVNKNIQIALCTEDKGKEYLFDTTQREQENLEDYFLTDWNYGNTAFEVEIDAKKIKKDVCYEVVIILTYEPLVDGEAHDLRTVNIATEKYIFNGQLYSYRVNQFIFPKFEDELMKRVVTAGDLCLYNAQESAYLYKYEDKLYWIAGENFTFNEQGKTYISYQIGTSLPERLATHRQEYGFENWDFYFEDREYSMKQDCGYRVAIMPMPEGYPITYYYTAIYDLENRIPLWGRIFYPTYNIN